MRASLAGLEGVDWATLHPNNAPGTEIPRLLRDWSNGVGFGGVPRQKSTPYRLTDMLLHQDTRFGGAGEALPFLLELAAADETPARAELVYFASGIGAPVEEWASGVAFDRELYARLSDDELWTHEDMEVLGGFAAMCAQDGRAAWKANLSRVSELVDDPDDEVRLAAIVVLAGEGAVAPEHEARLRRALTCESDVGWHAALALGERAETVPLEPATVERLTEALGDSAVVRRASAAFALARSGSVTDAVREALAEAEARRSELGAVKCRFVQPLAGMIASARHLL